MILAALVLYANGLVGTPTLDDPKPQLAWKVCEGSAQASIARVYVATSPSKLAAGEADLWDSGPISDPTAASVRYGGTLLRPNQPAFWRVDVLEAGDKGAVIDSGTGQWTLGLGAGGRWAGQWIGKDDPSYPSVAQDAAPEAKKALPLQRAVYARQTFNLSTAPVRAILHVTALGHFEPHLNGSRVGNDHFLPGWTNYRKRLYYFSYDVTDRVQAGRNMVGGILADGWYRGNISILGRHFHGSKTRARYQLHLQFADGSERIVASGPETRVGHGPILEADMQAGETHDARLQQPGWNTGEFEGGAWTAPDIGAEYEPELVLAYPAPSVRRILERAVVSYSRLNDDTVIADFGQNIAGWVRLRVRAPAGTAVRLRFAEMLKADGTLYTEALRSARATDTYICRGGGEEVWEPSFTFHGFRYAEISGLRGEPARNLITGIVAHSDLELTGAFECSNPLVNQVWQNAFWSQRANYFDIPTDCPQRDERLGWTGDTQVFAASAAYNMNAQAFLAKWMESVADAQTSAGEFPIMAPSAHPGWSPGWSDAGVIVPWTLYHFYGDRRVAARHLDRMERHLQAYLAKSKDLIGPDDGFGDWLSVGAETPRPLISTAYFAYSAQRVAELAKAVNRNDVATRAEDLNRRVKEAFQKAFVAEDGRVGTGTQTAYLMALRFNLLTPEQRAKAIPHFVKSIADADNHLATGFLGVNLLLPTLSDIGRDDLAYTIMQQRTYPSFGYPVEQGATTIWERWNSYTRDKGFGDVKMNSFNHYAYGACVEWLYRTVLGIDALQPGFAETLIAPRPGGGLSFARGHYDSVRGRIGSAWTLKDGVFTLDVDVPAQTRAVVRVPGSNVVVVEAPATPEAKSPYTLENETPEAATFRVAPGRYRFISKLVTQPAPSSSGR